MVAIDPVAVDYASETLSHRPDTLALATYETLADALPNVTYEYKSRRLITSDRVVLGRIVDVSKGVAYLLDDDTSENGTRTEFDDPRALWKTLHLQVAVDETIAGEAVRSVTVGIPLTEPGADFDKLRKGLMGLGRVVVYINSTDPNYAYSPGVLAGADAGRLIVPVDETEDLSVPFAEPDRRASLVGGVGTLGALRSAAVRPAIVKQVPGFDS